MSQPIKSSVVIEKPASSKGQQNKKILREKVVQIYSTFFRNIDASQGHPNFWDEMFLLKANPLCLEAELDKLTGEQLVDLMGTINLLFRKSVEVLLQDHPIRISNAFLTLSALTRGVMSKCSSGHGFDMINILIGFDSAEATMKRLLDRIGDILVSESPFTIKSLAFSLLTIFVTGYDNISLNTMLEYFMIDSIFESLVRVSLKSHKIISDPNIRHHFGCLGVQLISLLVQYRKSELVNPYVVKLSILDDELALTSFAQVISNSLSKYNMQYQQKLQEAETSGFFATLSNLVGNMFVGEETKTEAVKANDSLLLALYEAIHLNRNFISTLTHSHTTSPPPSSPEASNPGLDSEDVQKADTIQLQVNEVDNTPTNLLVTFLEYCSIISQDIKDMARYSSTKLCLVIFTCIAEDQFANSLMHDSNMTFRVTLHRIPMRHRRPTSVKKPPSRPLVCSLIDLMVEFIISHLMKNFPMELHMRCLGVIHRILCYQKKCRVRLNIQWRDLWSALINLLKFILSNEALLSKKFDIFHLCTRVLNIFNLFITYGDTFLSDPNSYDELYYEIIRTHQVFDNIYSLGLRYNSQEECPYKDSLLRLQNSLVNVRAIICHFTPKLESWSTAQHVASLTEKEVLDVVRNNYDSLTLKMQDSLDQYERYSEKPKDITSFFNHMVRGIIKDLRKSALDSYTNCPKLSFDASL